MSFRTRRVLFITPFYILFEFFLLKYILLLVLSIEDMYILILTLIIGFNHFLPMLFETKKSRAITRFLTVLDGVWMWASVMFLIDIIIIYSVGSVINMPFEANILLLAIVSIVGAYNYFKAHHLTVHEKIIELDNISREINIAHLSDIHFGSVRHKKIIEDIAFKLNGLDCDLAIISGDLADGSSAVFQDDFQAFEHVKMPVIFTPGNHDFYPGIDNVINACTNAGIIVLNNQSMEFKGLNIFGLSYRIEDRNPPKFDKGMVKKSMVNIINYHVPYYWEEFSDLGFDIQLSGHTHGGQFYPVVWFANLIFKYNKGLFKNSSGKYIHVTTGVGSMDTPMRWGTDSEIVVLKLRKI